MAEPSSPGVAARRLMRRARQGALATVGGDGWPFASLVTVACDLDASPLFLLSRLSEHTRNILRDRRASLLVEAAHGLANPQEGPRVTVTGRVEPSAEPGHARRFLARHPRARRYAGFGDFEFFRMAVEHAHFVGGFARAHRLKPGEFLADPAAAGALAAAEEGAIAHLNADHAEAVGLMAARLAGRRGGGWTAIGIDPDGVDLGRGERSFARLDFSGVVDSEAACRAELVRLAALARRPD